MKRLSLILAVTLLAFAGQAQLLWKVSGNQLGRPSYIMGTYHFAPSSMMDEIPGMEQALKGCDIVVGELKAADLNDPASQAMVAQALLAPADSTLDKLYSPEDFRVITQTFNKYFGGMGVKISQMNSFKPMAIITQMTALQSLKYFPENNPNALIDNAVQTRAEEMGRPSEGLETIKDQLDLLLNAPISTQAQVLLETCRQDDGYQLLSAALAEAYIHQDLDKILEVINGDAKDGDIVNEVLVYNRNRKWVENLVKIMPERSCLVCVGAGHLPGDKGLLQLLRDRGYTVEPMQ